MRVGVVGLEFDGAAQLGFGRVEPTIASGRDAEVIARHRIIGGMHDGLRDGGERAHRFAALEVKDTEIQPRGRVVGFDLQRAAQVALAFGRIAQPVFRGTEIDEGGKVVGFDFEHAQIRLARTFEIAGLERLDSFRADFFDNRGLHGRLGFVRNFNRHRGQGGGRCFHLADRTNRAAVRQTGIIVRPGLRAQTGERRDEGDEQRKLSLAHRRRPVRAPATWPRAPRPSRRNADRRAPTRPDRRWSCHRGWSPFRAARRDA